MKKVLDKLKFRVKIDKKMLIFFTTLLIAGIVMGIIFATILKATDKSLVQNHLNAFITNINDLNYNLTLKNNLISTGLYVFGIWLLGISVIGIPIIVGMFFIKAFILGFSIGAVFITFGTRGILFNLIYIIPSNIITMISLLILSIYAISFSLLLIYNIFKKKNMDFKVMVNKYIIVLSYSLIINILMALYNTYLMPYLIKTFFI